MSRDHPSLDPPLVAVPDPIPLDRGGGTSTIAIGYHVKSSLDADRVPNIVCAMDHGVGMARNIL